MFNSIKFYIALCLIGLQLVAPFIHAHAFGLDAFNERTLHLHADTAPLADFAITSLHKGDLHTAANSHAIVYDNFNDQQSGYVITVASGVNSSTDADAMLSPLIGITLLMVFALMLAQFAPHVVFSSTPSLSLSQLSYPTQNPRAPPR